MNLLADEIFPGIAVDALRAAGHDITWIKIAAPGADDKTVLAKALAENRVLVTFDKDFGELAFHARLPADSGIILFRISPSSPAYVAQKAVAAIASRSDWAGHFSVVDDHRIRMTPLPRP